MKYSTRPNNARDRSKQVNRSPPFKFQKQHRPQQDENTYSLSRILNQSPYQLCSLLSLLTTQPTTVFAKVQQPARPTSAQPTSYVVVDDQQPGTSRQLMFTLSPAKPVNPPSIGSGQQEDSQHNTSGLSSLFGGISSVLQYQQKDTPQPFSPSQLQPASSPVQSSTQQEESRPHSQSSKQSQPK